MVNQNNEDQVSDVSQRCSLKAIDDDVIEAQKPPQLFAAAKDITSANKNSKRQFSSEDMKMNMNVIQGSSRISEESKQEKVRYSYVSAGKK